MKTTKNKIKVKKQNSQGILKSHLLVILFISALFAGCGKDGAKPLSIGISLPLSGPAASYGEAGRKGVEIAYDRFLAENPDIKGRIVLDIQDDKASPKDAVSVYQKFHSANVRICLGPMVSGAAVAVTELAKNDDSLFILPTATHPSLRGRSPLVYRTCVSDDAEGSAVAEFAFKRDPKQVFAILHINNEYGLGVGAVFAENYRKYGGTIAMNEAYDSSVADFRDIIVKVRKSAATTLFLVGQKEQTQVIKQLRESGFLGQIYGTTMFEDSQLIQSSAADGALFSSRVLEDGTAGKLPNPLFGEYKKRFGGDANYYTAAFYDGATLALKCASALMKNPQVVLKDLPRSVGLKEGATGPLAFDEKNDVIQPFAFKMIVAGKAEVLK